MLAAVIATFEWLEPVVSVGESVESFSSISWVLFYSCRRRYQACETGCSPKWRMLLWCQQTLRGSIPQLLCLRDHMRLCPTCHSVASKRLVNVVMYLCACVFAMTVSHKHTAHITVCRSSMYMRQ